MISSTFRWLQPKVVSLNLWQWKIAFFTLDFSNSLNSQANFHCPLMFKTWDQIVALTVSQQGHSQYTCRGVTRGTELHIANPKKYISLKFYTQKNTWHQNFQPNEIQDLNTSILIYSIKQTLRPKKICDRSLDPSDPAPHVYCEYPPWEQLNPWLIHKYELTTDSSPKIT